MENWQIIFGVVVLYMIFVLGLGVSPATRVTRVAIDDYFKVSAGVGFLLLYLGVAGGFHTSFAIPGSMGFYYGHGVGFVVNVIWTVGTPVALIYLLGSRIHVLGKAYNYLTPSDLLTDYYGDGKESRGLRAFFAVFLLLFSLAYLVANITGPAVLLSFGTGGNVPYEMAATMMIVTSGIYVMRGGMRGVLWTTVLQSIWMFAALWAAGLWALSLVGGVPALLRGDLFAGVVAQDPKMWTTPGARNWLGDAMWATWPIFGIAIGWALQARSFMFAYSARNLETYKKMALTMGIYLALIYVPAMFIGFVAKIYVPGLTGAGADNSFPMLLAQYAPVWFTAIIIAGAMAAGMSTLDADFNANGAMLTKDVYKSLFRPRATEAHYMAVGRTLVMAVAGLCLVLAFQRWELVTMIVSLSNSGVAMLLPAVLGALFPMKAFRFTATGVVVGATVGAVVVASTTFGWFGLPVHPNGFHAGFWGMLVNFGLAIPLSLVTKAPSEETRRRFHGLLEATLYPKGEARPAAEPRPRIEPA
jgi:solute:Na+ symporter, SSS family